MSITSRSGNIIVDSGVFGPAVVATTGPVTPVGVQAIDGVTVGNGAESVLVKDQADATQNGIWIAQSGPWVRRKDAASNGAFAGGMLVPVLGGALNAGQIFMLTCTDDPIVVGTSELTFAELSAVQNALASATSTTSVTIGTGSRTFSVAGGKRFAAGQWVIVQDNANPANVLLGQVTSYGGGPLVLDVVATGGSGTGDDWTIVLTNSPAAAGYSPPVGTGNTTGAGSSIAGHIAVFADTSGKVLQDGGAIGTLAQRNIGATRPGDLGTSSVRASDLEPGAAPLAFNAGFGQATDNLALINDGTNPTRDLVISPGRVRSDTDSTNLQLAASMLKRFDQVWAAGGVAGAPAGVSLDGGGKGASQTWHVYLIGRRGIAVSQWSRTSGVVTLAASAHGLGVGSTVRVLGVDPAIDGIYPVSVVGDAGHVGFAVAGPDVSATPVSASIDGFDVAASQSYPSPTLPSGWADKQCLGSVVTDGSGNIRAFAQVGDTFWWNAPPEDQISQGGTGLRSITVPKGLLVEAIGNVFASISSVPAYVDITAPGLGQPAVHALYYNGLASVAIGGPFRCLTNASAQIGMTASNCVFSLSTLGYRDLRRRLF